MLSPRFKIQNDILGTLILSRPIGFKEASFETKEHPDFRDLSIDYTSGLKFYGSDGKNDGGMDRLLRIEREQGIDAEALFIIEMSTDGVNYNLEHSGMFDFESLEEIREEEKYVKINTKQTNIQTKTLKRKEHKVNLNDRISIDGAAISNYAPNVLTIQGRTLEKTFEANYSNDVPDFNTSNGQFEGDFGTYNIGFQNIIINEVQATSFTSMSNNDPIPMLVAPDDGDYQVDLSYTADLHIFSFKTVVFGGNEHPTPSRFIYETWYKINDGPRQSMKTVIVPETGVVFDFHFGYSFSMSQNFNLRKDDELFIFGSTFVDVGGSGQVYHQVNIKAGQALITGLTTFRETQAKSYTIHDAFAIICESITGKNNIFYSEFLGNLTTQFQSYLANGVFSYLALTNGKNLRGIDENFSASLMDLYSSLNAIVPLCLTFEKIDGVERIRIEHVRYAYNFEVHKQYRVKYLNRSVDKNLIYNKIISRYQKWEAENVNGRNEPNSSREYATQLKKVGREYKIESKVIAASQVIETTRRKFDEKTTDYKFDNDLFFLCLKRTLNGGSPSEMGQLEKDENYFSVLNYVKPETAMNLRLSPTMNVLRHSAMFSAGLRVYGGSVLKLTEAKGLENLTTGDNITFPGNFNGQLLDEAENIVWNYANIDDVEPIFTGNIYECKIPLSFEEYIELKDIENRDLNGNLTKFKSIQLSEDGIKWVTCRIRLKGYNPYQPLAEIEAYELNTEGVLNAAPSSMLITNGEKALITDDFNLILP